MGSLCPEVACKKKRNKKKQKETNKQTNKQITEVDLYVQDAGVVTNIRQLNISCCISME